MKKRTTLGKEGLSRRSLLSLFAATAGGAILAGCKSPFTRPTPEAIEIVEGPPPAMEFEGPIYTGTGAGYVIEFEKGTRFYFAGDTCLFSDMKFAIGDYHKPRRHLPAYWGTSTPWTLEQGPMPPRWSTPAT